MAKNFRNFRVRVLAQTFVGRGLEGRLAEAGEVVTIPLEIAEDEVKDENGNVIAQAGEPIHNDNIEILEDEDAAEVAPAGAPNGARPTGVPGVWMVPVGDSWQVWQPGDPDSGFSRRSPEEFQSNQPDAAPISDKNPLDHDEDGRAGGSKSKAEIAAELTEMGVEFDGRSSRDELAKKLAEAKADA